MLVPSCGGGLGDDDDDDGGADGRILTTPSIVSNSPEDGATNVFLNNSVTVVFTEEMDPSTLDGDTFTLTSGTSTAAIDGTMVYGNSTAVFWPAAHLTIDTGYTATITTDAQSAFGIALDLGRSWTFTTGDTLGPGFAVDLGTSGNHVILAKSGVSTVPASTITGNVAVSPAAATYITGFSLSAHATNVYSTSTQVTGRVYAANYAAPTPANLTTAIGDMQIAFTDAAARAPDVTEHGEGTLVAGTVLPPGVFKWSTGLLIPADVTLEGSATDVWIFQIAQDLDLSSGAEIILAGAARAQNIVWQVSGQATLGPSSHLEGIVLAQTAIRVQSGASVNGRLLAQTAVTLAAATVRQPTL